MVADGELVAEITPLAGTEHVAIDNKGRLLLSKKYRDRLGDVFAMNIGMRGCICVYPKDRWQEYMREINVCPGINQGRQDFIEYFFDYAETDMSCDAQGRVVIPLELRKQGKLTENVLVKGRFDHLELWDPEQHEIFRNDMDGYGKARKLAMESAYQKMKGG